MAEYYPLLTRAISNLGSTTLDTRQAIYSRARKALEAQLSHITPPDSELIARETNALEVAIARLEAEMEAQNAEAHRQAETLAAAQAAEEASVAAFGLAGGPSPALGVGPPPHGFSLPPVERGQVNGDQDAAPGDLSSLIAKLKDVSRPSIAQAVAMRPVVGQRAQPTAQPPHFSSRPHDVSLEQAPDVELGDGVEMLRPVAVSSLDAPVPRERGLVFAIVIGVIVFGVAIAAYILRDRPEDVAKLRSAANAERSDQPAAGKISERVGDTASSSAQISKDQPSSTATAAPQDQKAVLIFEAPGTDSGSKRVEGDVSWRLDNVNRGPVQEIIPALRGDIDFPELKLKVSMFIYKNMDPALSASHIIQLKFDTAADSPFVGVSQTDMLSMRLDDNAAQEYLQGIPMPVMTNYFLYALTQNERSVSFNVDLLRTRGQFDLLMIMTNNLHARIAFEKGEGGSKIFERATQILR